jgi:hypothetical protein
MQNLIRSLVWTSLALIAVAVPLTCFGQDDGRSSGQVRGNVYVYMNDGGQLRTIGTIYYGDSTQRYLEFTSYSLAFNYLDEKSGQGYQTNYIVQQGDCYDRNGDPCYDLN